jgi:hypothetical protein
MDTNTFPDKTWPDHQYRVCPHCGYVADEYKFILIDGSLECPECCEPIREEPPDEDWYRD